MPEVMGVGRPRNGILWPVSDQLQDHPCFLPIQCWPGGLFRLQAICVVSSSVRLM